MTPLLRLREVHKSYWRGAREVRVLCGVSLDMHPGELVGVYGQRASGKTTLLRLAAGFEMPSDGAVVFGGRDLATLSRGELARIHREAIAWVERAGPQCADLSMLDYLALPLYRKVGPARARKRAAAMLDKIHVADAADARWSELTDATRVLVAIAAALVREPRVVIVDDPTSGLDVIDRERVTRLLRWTADHEGVGILMAVPDLASMLHAHEIRSLNCGRLLAPTSQSRGTVVEFQRAKRPA